MPHDSNIITIYQSWAGKIFIQAPMREQQALDIALSLIHIFWDAFFDFPHPLFCDVGRAEDNAEGF